MHKLVLIGVRVLSACSRDQAPPSSSESPAPAAAVALPAGMSRVADPSQVCMVNNMFMGRSQIPVEVEGRTSFGCCPDCKKKLENQPATRRAHDPVTGEPVDKAKAVIVQDPVGQGLLLRERGHASPLPWIARKESVMGDYWRRYILEADPALVSRQRGTAIFTRNEERFELLHFARAGTPAVLISEGSAGTPHVFAELAYRIWERGFAVFIMPKHGSATLSHLVDRHEAALRRIRDLGHDRVGVFAEGLGGYAAFYLALAHGSLDSLICQNAPAIVTEEAYRRAIYSGPAGRRRRLLVPLARVLAKLSPRITLPISSYLDFGEMIDTVQPARDVERRLVETYAGDPDFDRRYSLSAILSLLDTPAPASVSALAVPTMFVVPTRGIIPAYEHELFDRLPAIEKKLVEVDGSVFWMISHSREAAELFSSWFERTLNTEGPHAYDPTGSSPRGVRDVE